MPDPEKSVDVVVIGAGAAGLMCAITAALRGRRVLVIEVSNKAGKKILMSGGGRCNFTNLHVQADNFICNNRHFVKSALSQYSQGDFIAWVSAHGIAFHEKTHGQLFCDNSSRDILKMLLDECQTAGVEILLNCTVDTVTAGEPYRLSTNRGNFNSENIVVATGGLSIPTLGGASGFGYSLARQFGLKINQTDASLVPLTLTGKWHEFAKSLAGVSVPVIASVATRGFSESMLFTHRGLSGPAILQLSNYWYSGATVSINLLPELAAGAMLVTAKSVESNATVTSIISRYLPNRLVQALGRAWWNQHGEPEKSLHAYRNAELTRLGELLNDWQLTPSGTEGYRTAEVTRGGVDVAQISSRTMQVNGLQGLYFIGEVLDVTGHLGGYNFQWAWSTGYVAGINV